MDAFWLFPPLALVPLLALVALVSGCAMLAPIAGKELRAATVVAALLVVVGGATIGVMEWRLRQFALDAGEPIHGLIGRPVPNGGGDHEYTPRGKEYEAKAFEQPCIVGVAVLGAIAIGVAVWSGKLRVLVPVSLLAVGIALVVLTFWIAREFTAWDIFI